MFARKSKVGHENDSAIFFAILARKSSKLRRNEINFFFFETLRIYLLIMIFLYLRL